MNTITYITQELFRPASHNLFCCTTKINFIMHAKGIELYGCSIGPDDFSQCGKIRSINMLQCTRGHLCAVQCHIQYIIMCNTMQYAQYCTIVMHTIVIIIYSARYCRNIMVARACKSQLAAPTCCFATLTCFSENPVPDW